MGSFTGMTMAKGVLDLKHLRGAEGQSKLFPAEGGFCYSQTKLAQVSQLRVHALSGLPACKDRGLTNESEVRSHGNRRTLFERRSKEVGVDPILRCVCVCVCVCMRDVKEKHTLLRPSCVQKPGGLTNESEVSSPVTDVLTCGWWYWAS